MADNVVDSSQVISGIAILLSFFVGYKYGIRTIAGNSDDEKPGSSSDSQKVRVSYIN